MCSSQTYKRETLLRNDEDEKVIEDFLKTVGEENSNKKHVELIPEPTDTV